MIKILCMNVDALPEACAQCYKVIPSWDLVKRVVKQGHLAVLRHGLLLPFASFVRQLERELTEARAEIERKDKLIEQMREALENIRDYPGHIDYTTGEVHSMQEIAIAALAAERGE